MKPVKDVGEYGSWYNLLRAANNQMDPKTMSLAKDVFPRLRALDDELFECSGSGAPTDEVAYMICTALKNIQNDRATYPNFRTKEEPLTEKQEAILIQAYCYALMRQTSEMRVTPDMLEAPFRLIQSIGKIQWR
ncbi:hypothetical protein HOF46_00965 [Candidatus Woesearchaeota archaeon]|nr:hypothetical protein [Candidatus Woesearchaeota archaeon]